MTASIVPLLCDGFENEPPARRVLHYVQSREERKHPVAGIYCGYAFIELLHAMDIVPAVLCAFSQASIATAETVLPANLCPLIKSSYGFIQEGTCLFYALPDAVSRPALPTTWNPTRWVSMWPRRTACRF